MPDFVRLPFGAPGRKRLPAAVLLLVATAVLSGCDAFNPSFLEVALPADQSLEATAATTTNATGHVPVFFVSNARFDGALLDYLEAQGVDINIPDLRPRVRVRATVTFADGTARPLEFVDGSQITETTTVSAGETTTATLPVDLLRPELNNQVLPCDVAEIRVDAESFTVYVPVFIRTFQVEEVEDQGLELRLLEILAPQFWPLERDEVDEYLNTTVVRNFPIRELPAPVFDLTCGSVVLYALEGTLEVPFVNEFNVSGVPGWNVDNEPTIEAFPGRFSVSTVVR
jgi:hypothetical protein